MHFSLLGPLHVRSDGAEIPIRGTLRRTLLAALLLNRDSVVSADRLSELLWGEGTAASTTPLYNQITRLRQALGDNNETGGGLIRAIPPGYLLHVTPDQLDLTEFADLCSQARKAAATTDWLASAKLYTAALALWRGEILTDIPALHDHPAIHQFTEDRLVALQGRIEADLNLGRHDDVIDELRTLTRSHPLREAFHAQLMLALYRAGRQADALNVYRHLRSATSSELGVEPGPAIQSLHTAIRASDPALTLPPPTPAPRPTHARVPVPRQLPADTRLFTGRHTELDELTSLATRGIGENSASGTVVISAINGMGGVGKTALAVRAAHHLRDRYPDGQLFIDLHGYSTDLDPVAPEDALDYLLRSIGVPPQSIPSELDARTALYRSKLANTRTLILLDNATNAAQVLPLLPAAPGCLVLITSRNRMMGLADGHLLALDVLPHPDAVALLGEVAGPTRAHDLAAHPDAVAELITLCAHTPLALRIVAARLRHTPTLTIAALNAELREEAHRITHIQDGDRDLTSVFNASLRTLPAPARRLYPLLGLIPGPDFDPYAAGHLAATDLPTAERHLETLLDHNLLIQHAPHRYRLHDLLRAHAHTLAAQDPAAPTAFDRLADFYVATACAADSLSVKRMTQRQIFEAPDATEPVLTFTDRLEARWIRRERANLLALIELPAIDRSRRDALIEAMTAFFGAEGPWHVAARLQTVLIESVRRRHDRDAEARILIELGRFTRDSGNPEQGLTYLHQALAIYRELGDERGEASSLYGIGFSHFRRGNFPPAVLAFEHAATIHRRVGPPSAYAETIEHLGTLAHCSGNNTGARAYFDEAIAIHKQTKSVTSEVNALLMKSRTAYALGDFDSVIPMLEASLALALRTTSPAMTATILQEIARQQLLIGEYAQAARLLDKALELHLQVGFSLGEGNVYWERGRIAVAHSRHHEAMELFTRSLDIFVEIGAETMEALARHELAKLYHVMGDLSPVEALLDRALDIYIDTSYPVGEAEVRNSIAAYRAEVDGAEVGLALYREAVDVAVRAEHPLERARGLEGMGRCEVRLGMLGAGIGHLREAVDLYARMKVVDLGAAAGFLAELEGAAESTAAGEQDHEQADQ